MPNMIANDSSDDDIVSLLRFVAQVAPNDAALAAELADSLRMSGATYNPGTDLTADVASTGGPSSLSTLLCPLFLRAGGVYVPKLGVPGRPAGGIDCLAQIKGYKTRIDDVELDAAMQSAGYAHFVAADRYAPLDARVFGLRQRYGFQEVPTLVAASLLSKKLAVGVKIAGLDIRVAPHGNFGRSMIQAQRNADLFTEAANSLKLVGRPVLTDGSMPYQPYIGRAEAIAAVAAVLSGSADAWLQEHVELCRMLSSITVLTSRRAAVDSASLEELQRWFLANLNAQGANEEAFAAVVDRVRVGHCIEIVALQDGFVAISLEGIRRALVAAQSAAALEDIDFPDPAGVILKRRPGDRVGRGDVLATVRIEDALIRDNVLLALERAIFAVDEDTSA